jgi:hypothetical protein
MIKGQTNDSNKYNDLSIDSSSNELNNNEVVQQPKAVNKNDNSLSSVINRLNKFNFKTANESSLIKYTSDLNLYKKLKAKEDRELAIAKQKRELEVKRNPFLKDIELCIQSITSNDVIDAAIKAGITSEEYEIEIIKALSSISNESLKSIFLSQYKVRKSKKNIFNSLKNNGEV